MLTTDKQIEKRMRRTLARHGMRLHSCGNGYFGIYADGDSIADCGPPMKLDKLVDEVNRMEERRREYLAERRRDYLETRNG